MLEHQQKAVDMIMKEMKTIMQAKSSDYSDHAIRQDITDNVTALGLAGLYVRMSDKMGRLYKFMWLDKENTVKSETIEDALIDLGNYCIISLMLRRGLWQKLKRR